MISDDLMAYVSDGLVIGDAVVYQCSSLRLENIIVKHKSKHKLIIIAHIKSQNHPHAEWREEGSLDGLGSRQV